MRQRNKGMKGFLFATFILLCIMSCNTSKQVERRLNKAYVKDMNLVAKKTAEWFPCETKRVVIDTNARREIVRIKDSLGKEIVRITDTINIVLYDTINNNQNIDRLRSTIKQANGLINILYNQLNNLPKDTIYLTDKAELTSLKYQLEGLNKDNNLYRGRERSALLWIIALVVISSLSIILNIIKLKK